MLQEKAILFFDSSMCTMSPQQMLFYILWEPETMSRVVAGVVAS